MATEEDCGKIWRLSSRNFNLLRRLTRRYERRNVATGAWMMAIRCLTHGKSAERMLGKLGSHNAKVNKFELAAQEEKQALLHLKPRCAMRDNCGLADTTR